MKTWKNHPQKYTWYTVLFLDHCDRDSRQKQILAKRRRSNKMLIVVSVAHFMSWLPLNVANVIITSFDSEQTPLFHST